MAHSLITLPSGNGLSLYYSKYHFKNDTLVKKKVIFEGNIKQLDKSLLEGTTINPGFKFIRVWKPIEKD